MRASRRDLIVLLLVGAFSLATEACATRSVDEPGHAALGGPARLLDASPRTVAREVETEISVDGGEPDGSEWSPAPPRLLELGLRIDKVHKASRLSWRQVQTLNWQAVADGLPSLPRERPLSSGKCPKGMVEIHGSLLLDAKGKLDTDGVLDLQDSACESWGVPRRICERFSEQKWKALAATLPRKAFRFCVDRYEYPNRHGEFPLVVTTFSESSKYCEKEGKRLCTESEWTLACEGEEGRPYPYGYARDATACPIDRPRVEPPEDTFVPRTTGHTARGIDTMWSGERSGAFARCVSPFGVSDMTGNVDEWTRSDRSWGYKMILKGGHWSYVRGRCRPQTRGHGPLYVNAETGFRCCRD